MPLLGPELTRGHYAHVLGRLLPILRSWEAWSEAHAPGRLHPLLTPRRRSHLLAADLRSLEGGNAVKPIERDNGAHPDWSSVVEDPTGTAGHRTKAECEARFLGAFYVLEGSTLGGRFLARQVETAIGLTPGQGNAYFLGHGANTNFLWKEITAEIAAVPDDLAEQLVGTARRTFAVFREALQNGTQRLQSEINDDPMKATAMAARTRQGYPASKLP